MPAREEPLVGCWLKLLKSSVCRDNQALITAASHAVRSVYVVSVAGTAACTEIEVQIEHRAMAKARLVVRVKIFMEIIA